MRILALGDAGRLAAATAQIIQLGAADLAAADHFDGFDQRRIDREDALDALAIGDLAHGEILVDAAAGAADEIAFVDEKLSLNGQIENEDWVSKAVALMAESTADEVPAGEDELADVDETGGESAGAPKAKAEKPAKKPKK